jgi:acyl-CoA hydrolase
MTEIIYQNDTIPMVILQGEVLVKWMNIASAISAQNNAEHIYVTTSTGSVKLKNLQKLIISYH